MTRLTVLQLALLALAQVAMTLALVMVVIAIVAAVGLLDLAASNQALAANAAKAFICASLGCGGTAWLIERAQRHGF
jgi:hypothetical protein